MSRYTTLVLCIFLVRCSIQIIQAQVIQFFPETDTVAVIGGCNEPEIISTISFGTNSDSIIISPGINTWLRYYNSLGTWGEIEKCYFVISDTSTDNEYELWSNAIGVLPYIQQIPFDTTFLISDNYFEIIFIVKSGGGAVDSFSQTFKSIYGLGTKDDLNLISQKIELSSNYPNPFNSNTTINYSIFNRSDINLSIYNIQGQLVETLLEKSQPPGKYSIGWNAENLSSGIYLINLGSEGKQRTILCHYLK